MPIKNLTLGLCLVLSGSALAHNQTYRIKEGDTLSGIADRFHVRTHAIVQANGLERLSTLKVGRVLIIPSASSSSDRRQAAHVPSAKGGYVVHKGENDVLIAKRVGLTTHQLHLLNPGVNWRALQLGQALRVSGKKTAVAAVAHKAAKKVSSTSGYVVRNGENDWIIAHRLGTTTVALKRLNPGVNLARLRPGQTIHVPGGAVAKASVPKLRSRYAVVSGDGVTIRRHPSRSAEAVTQVDAGTRVVVLDRDGDWYRLRFPKGTEGWVRGDLLKSAAAPVVAARSSRRSRRAQQEQRVAQAKRPSHTERVAARRHRSSHHEFTQSVVAFEKSEKGSGKADASKILEKAQSFRGVRYRWGAMSRSATDCSGFTSQVFGSQGYKLPRTSREQATTGIPVHAKDLKKGDLVFFHTMRGARVTHVGIYMGNGKFIHASSGGGKVQVNSLSDGYYKKRLVAARRVAKAPAKSKKAVESQVTKKSDDNSTATGEEK